MTRRFERRQLKPVRQQIAKQIPKQARKAGPESESEPDSGQNRRNATGISGDVDPSRGRPTDSAERPSN